MDIRVVPMVGVGGCAEDHNLTKGDLELPNMIVESDNLVGSGITSMHRNEARAGNSAYVHPPIGTRSPSTSDARWELGRALTIESRRRSPHRISTVCLASQRTKMQSADRE